MTQMISIKTNLVYNSIRVSVKMIFPILILPFITRNLGVEKFGLIEYAISIISYFIILSSLGIHNYGSREISIHRQSNRTLSKIILELFLLLILVSAISFIIFILLITLNSEFSKERLLYYILGIQILFTLTLSGEWIYEGIENQKFITYRTLAIQLIYIATILLFIRASDDYIIYAIITSLLNVVTVIVNLFFLKSNIKVQKIKLSELTPIRHLSSVLITFAAQISSLIYTQSAITIIGIFETMTSVGYFSVAAKVFRISTSLFSAFAGTLIPRLTFYWINKDYGSYKKLANNLLSYIILISIFLGLISNCLSRPIVMLLAGETYSNSILTLNILSFGILGSALSYFFGIIILYSQRCEKRFLYASIVTSIFNVLFNFIIILFVDYNGVALITVLSEYICFTFLFFRYKSNYLGIKLITKDNIKCIFSGTMCWLIIHYTLPINATNFNQLIIGLSIGITSYILFLLIVKHSIIMQLRSRLFTK